MSWFLLALVAHAGDGLQVVGALTHSARLAPGEEAHGQILVRNTSSEPITVDLRARDYRFSADGTNEFPPPGTLPRSNAAWTRFAPENLVLPAHADVAVAWTMAIPADADPAPGTWWSVVLVEPANDDPLADPHGLAVRTIFRYAVQLVTEVGDPEPAQLAFSGSRLVARDGHAALEIDLANHGDRQVTPDVWAGIFQADNTDLGRFDAGRLRLYPGCSGRFVIDLAGLEAATYSALVVADAGEDAAVGSQLSIDLTGLARAP